MGTAMNTDSGLVMLEIAVIGRPTTIAMLRERLPGMAVQRMYSAIGNNFTGGRLIRTGERGRYAYQLSESLQIFVNLNGAHAVMRGIANQRVCGEPPQAALQPTWPAMQASEPLRPAISTRLPWAAEEDLPPCIGERYRDALRPRPMDD
jgi:hypothetical protein